MPKLSHFGDTNLLHLNNNLLCAIDVIVTGPNPKYHSMIQVCFLPLNSQFKPHKAILPFYTDLKPKRPENIFNDNDKLPTGLGRERIYEATINGIDADLAVDRLETWIAKAEFKFGKKMTPLSHNWILKRDYLIDWLGPEHFRQFFDSNYRDLIPAALYANDKADHNVEQIPYPKVSLPYLASQLAIDKEKRMVDALQNCIAFGEIYKLMLRQLF